ncbi:MAG: SpoIIE family protein phosphatase [Candidatus Eremiobacteraeota bacterium]|nr:SpoIIE family protein phosphatase [Candidatus Eremiobacteraeota bacterium]
MRKRFYGWGWRSLERTTLDTGMNQNELLDAFPEIAWLLARDGRIAWFNRQWYEYTGQARVRVPSGADHSEQFRQAVDPADLAATQRALSDNVADNARDFALELRLRRADGVSRWFRVHLRAPSAAPEESDGWLAICIDVNDHKRQGQRFAFIARAGEALAESLDLQTTLERLLAIVIPDFGDWAAIDLFDEDGRLKTAAAIHADPRKTSLVKRLVARYNHNPNAETIIATALQRNRPLILNGVTRESIAKAAAPDLLEVLCSLSPHSAVTLPLRTRAGTIGSLVAYWAETPCEYSQEDLPLFAELTRRAAVAIENARLYEREREIATEFQRAALPISLPALPGARFNGIYVPASNRELIGGDWYDALRLSDGRIVVSIGDVAGSGLGAAVIMASMRQVIRGVAQVYADPIAMLDAADKTLKTEHPETFVTAFVGVLDPVARTLTYASAGHPAPLLRHADGSVEALRGGELPLGLRGRGEVPISIALPESSFLVFYSDGLIEADRDVIAGHERLLRTVARDDVAASPNPARALYDAMLGTDAGDDVVILTLGLDGSLGRRWMFDSSDAVSAQEARHAFVADLRGRGMASDTLHTAELIFGELLGNVVRYAPGPIEVMFDWNDNAPVLHVLDRGPGFTLVPRLPSDLLSERGRGLYIVWALAEDFNVTERFDGGSHARAVLATGVTVR